MAPMKGRIPERKSISGFVAWVAALAMFPGPMSPALALPGVRAGAAAPPAQEPVNGLVSVGLQVVVVDENGTAVPSARITLTPKLGTAVPGETDYAGRKEFTGLLPGDYS